MTGQKTKVTIKEANTAALHLLNCVIADNGESINRATVDATCEKLLSEYTVLVVPEAQYAIDEIAEYIRANRKTANQLNATFYRSWQDILSREEWQIKWDQFLSYSTTYGTWFSGEIWLPAHEVGLDPSLLDGNSDSVQFFMINVTTKDQIIDKCKKLICNGTALNGDTIHNCLTILDFLGVELDMELVKNKEAKTLLLDQSLARGRNEFKQCSPEELLRVIVYKATMSLLLIKDPVTLNQIRQRKLDVSTTFSEYGTEKLATIFNRFKPIFLELKASNPANKKVINEISRLSKTAHKPLVENPMNHVTHRKIDLKTDAKFLKNATVAVQLRALNACSLAMRPQRGFRYNIRNGKIWLADRESKVENTKAALENYLIILDHLKQKLGPQFMGKTVLCPEFISYGLPISEKKMVGNIPYGTRVRLSAKTEKIAVGIYWKEGYNCQDLDLSAQTLSGEKIGWNTSSRGGSFVYSGDVTYYTEEGATEYILINPQTDYYETAQLQVNCFSGDRFEHSFDIIIGKGDDVSRQYMMNPSNLISSFRYDASAGQNIIGFVSKTKDFIDLIILPGGLGNSRVSSAGTANPKGIALNAMKHFLEYSLTLNQLLEGLGANVVSSREPGIHIDYDLSLDKINRDFFNIFYQ